MVFGFGKRGQGAFEYILLLAGLMLVVLLILVTLNSINTSSQTSIQRTTCYQELMKSPGCLGPTRVFDPALNATATNPSSVPTCLKLWGSGVEQYNGSCAFVPANLRP
ncbi:MAG: hypothetical protein WC792_05690 [Candidatus Micrarchaeia archaeon]